MAYSERALSFTKIPVNAQVRMSDRVSYLYLEYCRVEQSDTGVVAVRQYEDDECSVDTIEIPCAGIAVIFLGPGTSITQAAAASCARAGATVVFSGGGGVPAYTVAVPLTSSARWATAQAMLAANQAAGRKAAKLLYKRQLGIDIQLDLTISQLRGIEGQMVKKVYRDCARKAGITGFRRDTNADDPVNVCLNLCNGILYGMVAAGCAALGINPALGIIHRGDVRALLFDIADTYKPKFTIPVAFAAAKQEDPEAYARKELRRIIFRQNLLEDSISLLMDLLAPHLPEIYDDRLISDRGDVPGHTSYSDNPRRSNSAVNVTIAELEP